MYLERNGRTLTVVTRFGTLECYNKIETILPLLNESFHLCLKGLYVNFDNIVTVFHGGIVFTNGEIKYLGMTNYQKMVKAFRRYIRQNTGVNASSRSFDEKVAK